MEQHTSIEPLPRARRLFIFGGLFTLFVLSLPALFLYATGYRFTFGDDVSFVRTGGIYVSADRSGAEIYIDEELVRETRTFRKAFYAQGITPGLHHISVQKEGFHTWVKELPVYEHLVTEAIAFNLPEVPSVRIIAPWRTIDGEVVIAATSTLHASTTNEFFVSQSILRSFIPDTEYATLLQLFETATSTETDAQTVVSVAEGVSSFLDAAPELATTTKESGGVRLYESNGDVFASWIGSRAQMPYYYCAKDFEYSIRYTDDMYADVAYNRGLIGPVQYVPEDVVCEPVIPIQQKGEKMTSFDFYPGSTDLVVLARTSGVFVTEIDDRAWQNTQPLLLGGGLDVRVANGNIYMYDGSLIYQVVIES